MKLYHTSPQKIKEIKSTGTFGESLCFSTSVYQITSSDTVFVYSIELDEEDVIDVFSFDEDDAPEVIQHISNVLDCDVSLALAYLRDKASPEDPELSWFIQGQMGSAAKEAGYKAARGVDEQGTVYIVPLLGREQELKLEN